MKKTFQDVWNLFDQEGYTITKDPAYTVRRYIVMNKNSKLKTSIRYIPTMTEMYHDLRKLGSEEFLRLHNAEASVSVKTPKNNVVKTKTKAIRKSKRDRVATPLAIEETSMLKKRNELYNNVVAETPTHIEAVTPQEYHYTSPIDYETKVPKVFNDYYFPSFTENVVGRIKLARNIHCSGAAGCLEADTKIDVRIDKKLLEIIEKNRMK